MLPDFSRSQLEPIQTIPLSTVILTRSKRPAVKSLSDSERDLEDHQPQPVPHPAYTRSKCFSISSSVFPFVSGKKNATVSKYTTVNPANRKNIRE